ncbi:RHS repeat-associated core domain-containing protein [Nannocystis exedens]|uniref:RHS repeat-associated core domain-containing protein n=1 Tax=Nannocystis exedens TaxID=54 RepID=A0A1I2FFL3_9BACT|nr:RHS repeat-associated core domain-containing protein [Nannocystis exedens]PCC70456.1 putative deoxyribonuclease RhsC [Nannocystis exedens]SFF04055.1 RHS repeat-associated core domain-containing protein [Nannocystis exedens]
MLIVGGQIRPAADTTVSSDETSGILMSALYEVVDARAAPFIAPRSAAEQQRRDAETALATATRLIGGSLAWLNVPVELLGTGFALLTAPLGAAAPPLPAATLASLHLGIPHLHSHPPAMPIPLPSFGPVALGGCTSVLIGGLPAARAGDLGVSITCGSLAPPFQVMTGSSKVFIGGSRAARSLDITRHCQTPLPPAGAAAKVAAGALASLPLALGAASAVLQRQQSRESERESREYAAMGDTTMAAAMAEVSAGQALGATMQAAQTAVDAVALAARLLMGKDPGTPPCFGALITGASDVQIGGFPMPPWRVTIGALGKLARGLKSRPRRHDLADGLHARARGNFKPGRIDNALPKRFCFLTGHPVDVIAGRVITDDVDLELSGPLRFGFERNYSSTWSARDSVVGHGWSHSLDQAVWVEHRQLVHRAEDGRELCFELPPGARLDRPLRLFDPRNRLTLTGDGDGRYTIEDAAGRLHDFAPVPGDTSPERGNARLVAVRARAGHTIACDYDARARLHRVRDSAGREYRLTYDRRSRLHRVFAPHPDREGLVRHVEYRYSPEGDLTEVVDALGQTTRYAYHRHRLVRHTLRTGLSFHFEYDGPEPGAACVRTWGDGGIYDHTLVYDKQRRVTVVTNSCGEPTVYAAGGRGEVVQITDPRGGVTRFEYDEHLRKTADVDPLGRVTRYEYDARGNCTRLVGPDGAELRVEYGSTGLPLAAIDALGGRWRYTHDHLGRLAARTDPLGQTTTYMYEGPHLAAVIDPAGRAARFFHDPAGDLVRVQFPDGTAEAWAHDRRGRPIAWTDVRGNLERRRYDLLDRLVAVELADGDRRTYAYDPEGHVLKFSDAHRDVHMTYAGMGCLVARTEAGATVRYTYDTEERLTAITNEAGAVYRFELDPAGDIKAEHGFDGLRRIYRRDLAGRVTEVFRPGGLRTAYARDAAGQLTGVFHSDGSSDAFTYRIDGAMLEAVHVEPDAEPVVLRFERDALGRVVRESQGEHWVAQLLGPDGLRSRLRSSLGARVQLSRDVMGSVLRIDAGERAWWAEIHREPGGLEARRDLPGDIRTRWQHDPRGLPTEHTIERVTPARLGARSHTFAHHQRRHSWAPGARLGRVDDLYRGRIEYEHDERGYLVSATYPQGQVELRLPEPAGNLFRDYERRGRTYGPAGQLLAADGKHFEYDREGNLIQTIDGDGTWRYRWTGSGNLAEVRRPDGERVTFTYDALGRRVSKTTKNGRTRWLWDGDVPLHEWTLAPDAPELPPCQRATDLASREPVERRFPCADEPELLTWIFEPDTFTPVARLSSREREAASLVADHLGTPIAAFDGAGRPVWSAELDVHGRIRDLAGDRRFCPFRYPGQYEDAETGLYYNRFRYYDPEAGQYISQDPLGLAAGLAFYAYVPDPLSAFDPLGLHKCDKKIRQTRPLDDLDIEHAWSRHAGELLGGTMASHVHRSAFVSILDRARRSGLTFFSHSGASATIAHLARIDGKYIVVHFFRDGPQAGKVASAWRPSQRQLRTYLRDARRDGP